MKYMKQRDESMKKVGIVSCYFHHNYGSILQAYATQRALEKLGYKNETIDISGFDRELKKEKIKYFVKASFTSDIFLTKLGMVKAAARRKFLKSGYSSNSKLRNKKMDDFIKREIHLSLKYDSQKVLSEICADQYSTVLVGSDQLWLPVNIAADYYTLNFVPDSVNTIAYATSFGQSSLPASSVRKAAVFLKRIRHLGVREDSGKRIIKELTGRDAALVCDPTLLFTGEEWKSYIEDKMIIEEPYILCYFLGSNPQHREFATHLRKISGYKIVALVHLDEYVKNDENYPDETPYDVDPSDFLNLIRHASYVCTDSFHGTVFSILYRKDFFCFRRYSDRSRQSTNGRLEMLFRMTGLDGRLLEGNEAVNECLARKMDFDEAYKRLEKIREDSWRYLGDALKDGNSGRYQ